MRSSTRPLSAPPPPQIELAQGLVVRGASGALVGTIDVVGQDHVVVLLSSGERANLPRAAVATTAEGAVISISAESCGAGSGGFTRSGRLTGGFVAPAAVFTPLPVAELLAPNLTLPFKTLARSASFRAGVVLSTAWNETIHPNASLILWVRSRVAYNASAIGIPQ